MRFLAIAVLAVVALAGLPSCKGYTDHLADVHRDVDRGDYDSAVDRLNGLLGVGSRETLPDQWTADRPLVALERGVLLQAQGHYALSTRDLSDAETELEFLDLKLDTAGNIGKYVYSDSSEVYKTPPTERLALNAINMLNYLALGELQGASVEARRFTVMREYLDGLDERSHCAAGSYLAGFVFERLGDPNRALRYYEEALEGGDLGHLGDAVVRVSQGASYRGERLRGWLGGRSGGTGPAPSGDRPAELIVVLALGRVPFKVQKTVPIGFAIGYASAFITGSTSVLERTAMKVVRYPELVATRNRYSGGSVTIDGRQVSPVQLTDFSQEITREYEQLKPKIIGAALTRMIARAIAAEGTRRTGLLGTLGALVFEGAAAAHDVPDTRSWTLLPRQLHVARTTVEPGRHTVRIRLQGTPSHTVEREVEVDASGFHVVVVTEPRSLPPVNSRPKR